ncbi:MAG: 1,2-phenylacetyl-CoA epoxidase subunit B [Bacteroidia bacterium]|nr:1,2-phenylacetyl-CoA epoxidase subunit B [Bacteroidia bacterium]
MKPSLDPRINRFGLHGDAKDFEQAEDLDQWQTYEVFHQKSRGEQHVHVGSVHAANAEMALLFAKEQFARRQKCVNLWVVRTADIFASEYKDEDMFIHSTDKSYREAWGYRVRDLINQYKKENQIDTVVNERTTERKIDLQSQSSETKTNKIPFKSKNIPKLES